MFEKKLDCRGRELCEERFATFVGFDGRDEDIVHRREHTFEAVDVDGVIDQGDGISTGHALRQTESGSEIAILVILAGIKLHACAVGDLEEILGVSCIDDVVTTVGITFADLSHIA